MVKNVRMKKVLFKNGKDVDVYVRDAFGNEYLLFPNEEKELTVLVREQKNDRRRLNSSRSG